MGGRRRKFCCVGGRAQIGKAGLSKNAGSLGTPREKRSEDRGKAGFESGIAHGWTQLKNILIAIPAQNRKKAFLEYCLVQSDSEFAAEIAAQKEKHGDHDCSGDIYIACFVEGA